MRKKCSVILILLLFVGIAKPLYADNSRTFAGARPMGMAGAFVAVADDANATIWNPAGLADLDGWGMTFMGAWWYGKIVRQGLLAFTKDVGRGTVGSAFNYILSDDRGLRYTMYDLGLCYGRELGGGLSLGSSLNTDHSVMRLKGRSILSDRGWSADLGLLYKPLPFFQMGVVSWDILGDAASEGKITAGLAVKPLPIMCIAIDCEDLDTKYEIKFRNLRVGVEVWLVKYVRMRAGVMKDITSDAPVRLSIGFSVMVENISLDYGFMAHPDLGDTHRVSVTMPIVPRKNIDKYIEELVEDIKDHIPSGKSIVVGYFLQEGTKNTKFGDYIRSSISVKIKAEPKRYKVVTEEDASDEIIKRKELERDVIYDQEKVSELGKALGADIILSGKYWDDETFVNIQAVLKYTETMSNIHATDKRIPKSAIPSSYKPFAK